MNYAHFQKPSRYIGNEVNSIRKDACIKVALCFPDAYEIGMSHLGLKILYSIINSIPYASAERVFAPWTDFESFLRKTSQPLTSLENKRPLKDFDIAGFTLQYELSYTNVLNMLDLGGIPIKAVNRGDNYPLIIAGGPCAVNPLPLIPFIDVFVIGDGEEVIGEIIETYKNVRYQTSDVRCQNKGFKVKESLLKALSGLEGVYVPSLHSHEPRKVKKRILTNLDKAAFPELPLVPFTSIVHDRISIEISRGCTRGCRFCQAGMIQRPLRERSIKKILSLSEKSLVNTGYEEISFSSLSTGDYSGLLTLIKNFKELQSSCQTAISLPSLRVGALSRDILKEIKSIRKTGFTIAPEAGTKRLRDVINKDFTEKEYEDTLETLFAEGWKSIKLYFMIGLPTETKDDIDGIITMAELALKKGREIVGKRMNINVSVSDFVPKPHTPFQWLGQMSHEELRERKNHLKKAFSRSKGLTFKGQFVESSLLEAVFSRGNSDCAQLLENAWKEGCRFDGWTEIFDFDKWLLASEKTGIDLYKYASRTLDINKELPWEFIDTGVTKEFLISEYQNAIKGKITQDCSYICCKCGLECKDRGQGSEIRLLTTDNRQLTTNLSPITHSPKTTNSIKLRIRFSKTGELRYLSHLEVMTAFLRAIRRAKILLIYSKGNHPHPKISFGPALPVGVEGTNEYFDIELPGVNPHRFASPLEIVKRFQGLSPGNAKHFTGQSEAVGAILLKINNSLPKGLEVLAVAPVSKNSRSLDDFISRYEYEISTDKGINRAIDSFLNLPQHLIARGGKVVDIRRMIEKAAINNGCLNLILVDTNGAKVRLYEILKELFQKPVEEIKSMPIKRVQLYGYANGKWTNPWKKVEKYGY